MVLEGQRLPTPDKDKAIRMKAAYAEELMLKATVDARSYQE